ncbi:peptidase M64 [bacterium]|nr:MAG: peptidase M64 [bacterium]RKZ16238.1 MAG: peptidase M64 [bacterium]
MLSMLLMATVLVSAPMDFEDHFTGQTLRFDYFHSGVAAEEHISLDAFRIEGEWPGSRTQLIDPTGLGKYQVEMRDLQSQAVLYSRGFASIYGEWETTGEARRGIWRTFHESQRMPEPARPVQVILRKREHAGGFVEIFSCTVDPGSRFVQRMPVRKQGELWAFQEKGDPSVKVDLLIIGDGYAADEMDKYRADVARHAEALFAAEPFKSRRDDFNVWAIDLPSQESGITRPRADAWVRTPLGLSFNAFDSERYVLTYENRELREIAAQAPYDAIMFMGNTRKYGGGGIFNLWATTSSDTSVSEYVFVHEFGHSFGGLADEYYTSQIAYEDFNPAGTEPWEPNVTALLDPENIKWAEFVDDDTPLPTPWKQDAYDETSYDYQKKRNEARARHAPDEEVEQLFAELKEITTPMLQGEEYFGKVGAFEGAGYEAKGLYRPEPDCIMFTRNPENFCRVCSAALERMINLYSE